MNIEFDNAFSSVVKGFEVMCVEADVVNGPTCDELWERIETALARIKATTPMEQVRLRPAIDGIRRAYKACGKDPNRYRPSSEALCRRAVKGLDLYRTLTVIDLINLVSIESGHSIGGFDADKVVGDTIVLGVGRPGEPYEAIGRGPLNIEGLPVYRDAVGGIGTPTSDNERTKLTPDTRRLLMTVNLYAPGEIDRAQVEKLVIELLEKYAFAKNIRITYECCS